MTPPAAAEIAPIPRRAIAYLIDTFIAAGLAIVLWGALLVVAALAGPEGMPTTILIGAPIVTLLLLGWFIVYTLMQAGAGSIGMRAQGVRMVSVRDRASVGFGRALLRNIVFGLAAAIVIGYFTPLFDGSGRFQGWHDKVAGALLLNARAAVAHSPAEAADEPADGVEGTSETAGAIVVAEEREGPAGLATPTSPPLPPAPSQRTQSAPGDSGPAGGAPGEGAALIAFVPGVSQSAAASAPVVVEPAAAVDQTVHAAPAVRERVEPDAHDIEDTRISIPGHRLVFTWDDGTRVAVSRRTIFGRNPAPEDGAVIVAVRDETLSLSKTHFEAAAEASGGWVVDRHSTNGMTLVRDGQRIACPAGQRVAVRLGDAIEIGDRIVTIGGYA
jgi:uncharacterized RDD family membrane protein YckC